MSERSGNNSSSGRKKGSSGRSYRSKAGLTLQPKKMRGRKPSSQRWLTRQLNDPFVAEAQSRGFLSRAAIKLEQMDDKHQFLVPHMRVVDLPVLGGWLQVVMKRCRIETGKGALVGIDLLEVDPVPGANFWSVTLPIPHSQSGSHRHKWPGGRGSVQIWRRQPVIARPTICGPWVCLKSRLILLIRCWRRAAFFWPKLFAAAVTDSFRIC